MAADGPEAVQPDRVREVSAAVEGETELLGWANRFALLGIPTGYACSTAITE